MTTARASGSVLRSLFAWLVIMSVCTAQEKPAPEPEEQATLSLGSTELCAYATLAWKNGFPKTARLVWLEVIGEYDADDEGARKALGYYRHGAVWQLDPKFTFPEQDEPDAGAARTLERRWDAVAKRLGAAHGKLAADLAAAGKDARAEYHVQRALRFQRRDAKLGEAAGLAQFEGITGTEVEIALLRRSRLMDRAIERLTTQAMPDVQAAPNDVALDKGGVPYEGVRSEHFTVYGDWDRDVLQEAAAWAERSLAFCQEAFEGYKGFPPAGMPSRSMAFFKRRDTWVEVVRKNADRVGRDEVAFVIANASSTKIGEMHAAGVEEVPIVFDLAVRWVVQDYSGMRSDAMVEGVGHAVVGMFFGRNLVFTVGREKVEGTVSGERESPKLLLPDMDTWRDLAVDLAWSHSGTAAARLPLLKAAQFPTDGRIKSWSFCDYLLRRDPRLLRDLDAAAPKARTEPEVHGEFTERAKLSLLEVEAGWRRFWTEDSELKRAILGKSTPLEATSKEAPAWLEEFNGARQQYGASPVGWSAQLSIDCRQHVGYLKANKGERGAAAQQTQQAGKTGFSSSGRAFAQSAIVWTGKVKKATEQWMLLPGYRDAILNKNIDTVGLYADGGIMVLDADRGRAVKAAVDSAWWPDAQQNGRAREAVPGAVDVDLLGPEVERLLNDNGRGRQKKVGLPLTMHTYGAAAKDLSCTVTSQGETIEGFLVQGTGRNRRTSAPGLWTFYPAEPLRRGLDVHVTWKWDGGSRDVTFAVE
jgi:hypothetical protein